MEWRTKLCWKEVRGRGSCYPLHCGLSQQRLRPSPAAKLGRDSIRMDVSVSGTCKRVAGNRECFALSLLAPALPSVQGDMTLPVLPARCACRRYEEPHGVHILDKETCSNCSARPAWPQPVLQQTWAEGTKHVWYDCGFAKLVSHQYGWTCYTSHTAGLAPRVFIKRSSDNNIQWSYCTDM